MWGFLMKWGLIGASNIAKQFMINAINSQQGSKVAAVLSGDATRGRAFADDYGIEWATTDIDELLDDQTIEGVYISTTNEKHYPQAMKAIAAGKHVMCEKPLAMNIEHACQMVSAAARANVVFATNHHLRNAGSHLKIKELIDQGRVGDVQAIRIGHAVYLPSNLHGWRINNPQVGGGSILDQVVHDADTIRFHLQEDPQEIVAIERSESLGKDVEDSVMSVWQMPSGILVHTHAGYTVKHAGTSYEVHGTEGSIFARGVMTQQPVGEIHLHRENQTEVQEFSNHDLYIRSMRLFMDAVNNGGSPAATGVDGIKSLAVALAVKEAATTGHRVKVNYGET